MTAETIRGKFVAQRIREDLRAHIGALGDKPGLGVIMVGGNESNRQYIDAIGNTGAKIGVDVRKIFLPETVDPAELQDAIRALNADERINGVLLQLPLPGDLNESGTRRAIIDTIDPDKDVDGVTTTSKQRVAEGSQGGFVPCTPLASMRLVEQVHPEGLAGKKAVMVGMSDVMGAPMVRLMLDAGADVTGYSLGRNPDNSFTVCRHRWESGEEVRTTTTGAEQIAEAKASDILVVAIGNKNRIINERWVKEGGTVIDVGINVLENGKTVGDVDFDRAAEVAGHITPVPGGVGIMTNAVLMENTVLAYHRQHPERALGEAAARWTARPGIQPGTLAPDAVRAHDAAVHRG